MEEGSSGLLAAEQTTSTALSQATDLPSAHTSGAAESDRSNVPRNTACFRCRARKQACRSTANEPIIQPEGACKRCSTRGLDCTFSVSSGDSMPRFAVFKHDQERSRMNPATGPLHTSPESNSAKPRTRAFVACDRCYDQQVACRDDNEEGYYPYNAGSSCKRCTAAGAVCEYKTDRVKVYQTESWELWACQSCHDDRRTCVASLTAVKRASVYPCLSCLNGPPGVKETCAPHGGRRPPSSFKLSSPVKETVQALTEPKRPSGPRTQTDIVTPDFTVEDDNEAVATASRFSMTEPGMHSGFAAFTTPGLYSGMVGRGDYIHTKQEAASRELSAGGFECGDATIDMWNPPVPAMSSDPLKYQPQDANFGEGYSESGYHAHADNFSYFAFQPPLPPEEEVSGQQAPRDDHGYAGGDNPKMAYYLPHSYDSFPE